MSITTSELSAGVRLIIDRRRRKLTQAEAAKKHKVSLYRYRGWELDEGDVPDVAIGLLQPHEKAYTLRITKGVSLAAQAKKMGISRWWLRQMERGTATPDRLLRAWGL